MTKDLFTKNQEYLSVDTILTLKIPNPFQNISARNDLIPITFVPPITLSFWESQLITVRLYSYKNTAKDQDLVTVITEKSLKKQNMFIGISGHPFAAFS